MVYTSRRRRILRVLSLGVFLIGCFAIVQWWKSRLLPFVGSITTKEKNDILSGLKINVRAQNAKLVLHGKPYEDEDQENISWVKHPWTTSLYGFLNIHVWHDWCGSAVNDLRRNVHFPKYPDVKLKTKLFYVSHNAENFGQRVFGFVHPPRTGYYTFAISSDDSSELWLSTGENPMKSQLIAWVGNLTNPNWQEIVGEGEFTRYKSQISSPVLLHRERRYFIEALHKQSSSYDHLLVAWKMPGFVNFTYITRARISQYIHPHEMHNLDVTRYSLHIPMSPAVVQPAYEMVKLGKEVPKGIPTSNIQIPRFTRGKGNNYSKTIAPELFSRLHSRIMSFSSLLYPSCEYKPSYQVDFNVSRYEGVYLIHETAVYPYDNTHLKHVEHYKPCFKMRVRDSHGLRLPWVNDEEFYQMGDSLDDHGMADVKHDVVHQETSRGYLARSTSRNYSPFESFTQRKTLAVFLNRTRLPYHRYRLYLPMKKDIESQNVKSKMSEKRPREESDRKGVLDHIAKKMMEKITEIWRRAVAGHENRSERDSTRNSFPKKLKTTSNFVHRENNDVSLLGKETFHKLKGSGQWKKILAYAKREKLLVTRKTWMYVAWKYFRYEKPEKPHDKLVEFIYKQHPTLCRTDGNILLNKDVAKGVVKRYINDLRSLYSSDINLRKVLNVEENHDVLKGDRYLIELELEFKDRNKPILVSDYVYQPLGASSFCAPKHFVWKKNVTVHVIVPVKNQGKWVQHFINDMSELYESTKDEQINVIIVDFNSTDLNIELALRRSSLKRYRVLQVGGSFQRALGVQIGANSVENPDDIIFTCDLHLDIPNNMIDILRKHCIQGRMAFSPMVLRLDCGFTPSLSYGEWETMGYGLFAIYKSDFDRIGGMNVDEFKTKWGGEDWEMVDRCLQKGLEIERLRVPNFYHYYHSKQGMWGSYGFEDNVLGNTGNRIGEDAIVPTYKAYKTLRYRYNQALMPEY